MIDLIKLQTKINEYLNTLDGDHNDETWTTDRALAAGELGEFMTWLEENNN